jgi:putative PIN family toxin of toxin-antitoxin system
MKVLIDTNILVSAALFPQSIPARAFFKAVTPPFRAVVCDYSLDELRRVFNAKFPHKISDYERFLAILAVSVEIISTPPDEESIESETQIRDTKDRPILRAAVSATVDIVITGDKDFLESGLVNPHIIAPAAFLQME